VTIESDLTGKYNIHDLEVTMNNHEFSKKITMIKVIRAATGCNLQKAKNFVERYIKSFNP
jgi:ribosomal protein L7/L12